MIIPFFIHKNQLKLQKTQFHRRILHIFRAKCALLQFYLLPLPIVIINKNMADINRIKVVLVEKKKTNKWLAEQLNKDATTVSKWCTNSAQPSLETLLEIAKVLEVDPRELIVPIDTQKVMMSIL